MSAVLDPQPKKPAVSPVLRTAARLLTELQPGQSAVINGLTWAGYRWIDRKRDEVRPKLKLAYHRGSLELMSVSLRHDGISRRLQDMIKLFCLTHGILMRGAGGTTIERDDVESAIEPDESFYIQNAAVIADVTDLDFSIHPPPDLVIEVDRSRSSLPKQPIYADLGVPELWRYTATAVTFAVRTRRGTYRSQSASRALPLVTSADVTRLVFTEPNNDTAYLAAVMSWAANLKPTSK